MNSRWIAAELRGVLVHPSDRRAALANDLAERDVRGKRVVHRHHAHAGAGEAFGHEARIGTVEETPIAAVKEHENRRRPRGRGRKDIEPLWLARTIGNREPTRQMRTHA